MRGEAEPQEQLEQKLIKAPRRVWKEYERRGEAEGLKDWRRLVTRLLVQEIDATTEQVA